MSEGASLSIEEDNEAYEDEEFGISNLEAKMQGIQQ
jgi:hypothetical protein